MVDLKQMDTAGLGKLAVECRAQLATAKRALAAVEGELDRRKVGEGVAVLESAGKDHGTATFSSEGMRFKVEAKKKVTWDSEKLKEVAATLSWETVEKIFDIKFSVPEKIYGAITDGELLQQINGCRTTEIGEPKVVFVGFDGE